MAIRFYSSSYNLFNETNQLDELMKKEQFDPTSARHLKVLENHTNQVKVRLKQLQRMDKQIAYSFLTGSAAFLFSFMPAFQYIVIGSVGYGCHLMTKRQQEYQDYQQALANLVDCTAWVYLNKTNGSFEQTEIKEMLRILKPLIREEDLKIFLEANLAKRIGRQLESLGNQDVNFEDYNLNKDQKGLFYDIYGYGKGGTAAIFKVVLYAFKLIYNYVHPNRKDTDENIPEAAGMNMG